jgi:recombinational DNA repair protein (RecF pathway)
MSYVTYTTEALVCGSYDQGVADKNLLLFTRELGMIYALAKSAREERSKQRSALQDFSRIRVSLVKGKTGWRVGSVESHGNYYLEAGSGDKRGSVVSLFRLLRRFIRGEEVHTDLYDEIIEALDAGLTDLPDRVIFDKLVQLRLLDQLGYVDVSALPAGIDWRGLKFQGEVSPALLAKLEVALTKATDHSHL